jgi:cytochrome c-type biogenesis protein CcmE
MSEDLQLTQENQILPEKNPVAKRLNKGIIITAGVALVITIVLSLFIYNLNKQISVLKVTVATNKNTIDSDIKTVNDKLKGMEGLAAKVDRTTSLTLLAVMAHEIEGGVVTDDFVVEKMSCVTLDNKLSLSIDLNTQPDMFGKYKGKGSFDLTDRELRTKATDIINKVKDFYVSNTIDGMPKLDDNTEIKLTIKNYDIGKMSKGEFVLAGEK